ncbi:Uncharacterized protein TCM_013941 isoform 5 [Theobroma cacao]|uniref:Uncharacterized protein isoform 5 n=1 Tax=Theobroma cacao TaxID=3641 RepID=A0A061FX25_THECC|nr:Uncharacterized protein TCM_013941 isoform 5 [Theobroma cacao]
MVMGRVRNWWNHSKTVAFIWFFSLALFYSLFQMALQNSTSPSSGNSGISNNQRRSIMYDKMARDLDERGAAFLKHGETSQSLSLSDLFTLKDGSVRPVLKAVNPPVRANVPLEIVLDRVILTSTGVLLGCWQVISGTDPISIRAMLRTALPRAPEKQLYDAAILHTSFARLLGHPKASLMDPDNTSKQLELFHKLVTQLNNKIHGFKAVVSQLWYVEEYDVLALALNGRMKVRRFQLGCS